MLTLFQKNSCEVEIKKSRFIAIAQRADSPEEARDQLNCVRNDDANHNCWAYKIGDEYRFYDDGEPGGTAGRPILAAIEGQGVDHVMVVVIRYFGGIKLGAGGLVRAYGGTAAKCISTAEKKEIVPMIVGKLKVPFDAIGVLYPILEKYNCNKLGETYEDCGLAMTIELKQSDSPAFANSLRDATRGTANYIIVKNES